MAGLPRVSVGVRRSRFEAGVLRDMNLTRETFRAALVGMLLVFLSFNIVALVHKQWLAILPLGVQLGVLASLVTNARMQVILVKIWSGAMCLGGGAGWVATFANVVLAMLDPEKAVPHRFELVFMLRNTFFLIIGLFVYRNCARLLGPTESETLKSGKVPSVGA